MKDLIKREINVLEKALSNETDSNIIDSIKTRLLSLYQDLNKDNPIGRPSLGITKKVSLTLPEEFWDKLEIAKVQSESSSMSELLRKIITAAIE
jgi:hypothetical protein